MKQDNTNYYNDFIKKNANYNFAADITTILLCTLIPFVLIGYEILLHFNIIKSNNNFLGIISVSVMMLVAFTTGIITYIVAINEKRNKLLFYILVYLPSLYLILFILLVSGVYCPVSVCWILDMISIYTFFRNKGIIVCSLLLIMTILTDILLIHPGDTNIFINDLMMTLFILPSSLIVIFISRTHEIRQEKYLQSKIKESLQRDRVAAIVNNLSDAIISTDTNGIIRVYNAASLELLDTNIDLNGRSINKILPLIDSKNSSFNVLNYLLKLKTVVQRDDLFYRYNENEKISLAVTFTPIRKGFSDNKKTEHKEGFIIIMRDITKQKNLDEERDDFISIVSHELRTPITTVEGSISNIGFMLTLPNTTLPILKEPVETAHNQIMFLADLVNDLSALSRAERNVGGDPEEINIHELVDSLITKYINDANKKDVKLESNISPNIKTINVSRLYIDELLQNLVSNAVKYTKKGSVTLKVENTDDSILFSVTDTGIGISKSDQDKIFGKFYRSEDYRTRETGGTGLGLYVAQQLAAKLGSKIEMKSELNVGSIFSFTIDTINKVKKP